MLRFFTAPRLALNPNSIFEIGSRINPRTRNTEKGKLKGLDKTIFLSIVSDSIFIFCSNATKTFEILIS
jgi:hypothetical protein